MKIETISKQLSILDRYLSIWILLAMIAGIAISYFLPSLGASVMEISFGGISLPIAIGLIIMMYPPLAKVNYTKLPKVFKDVRVLSLSLILNWIIGPILMFGLALVFLRGHPEFMVGLIIIGIARCIAMVLVWNGIAKGNKEYCAALVAFNSIFQIIFFSVYAYVFLSIIMPLFGLPAIDAQITMGHIAKSVAIYLGIPFLAGIITRYWLTIKKGQKWYEEKFLPRISPLTLIALLFTIVMMFTMQGDKIIRMPSDVLAISIPLVLYFALMFMIAWSISKKLGLTTDKVKTIAFTAASNNFELALAVAIATFGIHSNIAFATIIGPLIEVPVMLALVKIVTFHRNGASSSHNQIADAQA